MIEIQGAPEICVSVEMDGCISIIVTWIGTDEKPLSDMVCFPLGSAKNVADTLLKLAVEH